MKLRCTTNSIRLRLRKSDLHSLALHKTIVETVSFPSGMQMTYALNIHNLSEIQADFSNNAMRISIPTQLADSWINSNEVSIETTLKLDKNEKLHILIEKDFPCKDREEENKEDTFWELTEGDKSC